MLLLSSFALFITLISAQGQQGGGGGAATTAAPGGKGAGGGGGGGAVATPFWCPPGSAYKGGPRMGPYGQDCTPSQGDCPSQCGVIGEALKGTGKIECTHNFDCCTCGIMECRDCYELNCNGDQSCLGAKNIQIFGNKAAGAIISCNGDISCSGTIIQGNNIATISCTGDQACEYATMVLTCMLPLGCPLNCVGDNSCAANPLNKVTENAVFDITNSNGLYCSARACQFATFSLKQNVGGYIGCSAYDACKGALIIADQNIGSLSCAGMDACRGATVYITNPTGGTFSVMCNAAFACEGMKLYIIVTDPTIETLGGIECGAASACENAQITIVKQHPYPMNQKLTLSSLSCNGPKSCRNLRVVKSMAVEFGNCFCDTSPLSEACVGLTGIPKCLV